MGKNRGTKYLNHNNREDNFKDFFLYKERLGNFLYRGDTEKVIGQSHHSTQFFLLSKSFTWAHFEHAKTVFRNSSV